MFDFLFKKKDPIHEPRIGEVWYMSDRKMPNYGAEYQIITRDIRGVGFCKLTLEISTFTRYESVNIFLRDYKFLRDNV